MSKLNCCDKCRFYSHDLALNILLVWTATPVQILSLTRKELTMKQWYSTSPWQPEDTSSYTGELVLEPLQRLTLSQKT